MLPAGPICLLFEMLVMDLKCYAHPTPPLNLVKKITKHSFIRKFSVTKAWHYLNIPKPNVL